MPTPFLRSHIGVARLRVTPDPAPDDHPAMPPRPRGSRRPHTDGKVAQVRRLIETPRSPTGRSRRAPASGAPASAAGRRMADGSGRCSRRARPTPCRARARATSSGAARWRRASPRWPNATFASLRTAAASTPKSSARRWSFEDGEARRDGPQAAAQARARLASSRRTAGRCARSPNYARRTWTFTRAPRAALEDFLEQPRRAARGGEAATRRRGAAAGSRATSIIGGCWRGSEWHQRGKPSKKAHESRRRS